MPFIKLIPHATPNLIETTLLSEVEKKRKQHIIANYIKKYSKEKLDKGPEGMRVNLTDDLMIVRSEKYLTTLEKFLIEKNDDAVETIREMRISAVNKLIEDGEIIKFIEKELNVRVTYCIYDSFPLDDYCLWLLIFDRKIV
jgi:uncharacterized protein YbcI